MYIGFDAKRAFHNSTGIGNYSRTLIHSLSTFYPDEKFVLFNPKPGKEFTVSGENMQEINPSGFLSTLFPSVWRSRWMVKDIERYTDIYHGLSNELPFGIHRSKVKKVVTIHDLIFEHYPEQYNKNDVLIYSKKFRYACEHADRIIAISESTKNDLVELYAIPEEKITVCYQSCDERFFTRSPENYKEIIRKKYKMTRPFILSVGSIIERKNLLRLCQAFELLQKETDLDLVIIGKGNGAYKKEVLAFIESHHLSERCKFLEDKYDGNEIHNDLPVIYQLSEALAYPSLMEGFGIPVLEAMASGIPVVTSDISSLPEVGGDAALCINSNDSVEIYKALKRFLEDEPFKKEQLQKGIQRAQLFNNKNTCKQIMNIYKELNAPS